MKKIAGISLALMILLAFAVNTLASDNLLTKGNIAADEGNIQKATRYYQDYIESHPTTRGTYPPQYRKKKQYYIRNLLIACSNLLDIYRQNGESEEITKCINKLNDACSGTRFGSKNMYRLALIYFENDFSENAIDLLEQIIEEQRENYVPYNNKVALRAYSKLLKTCEARGENGEIAALIESLESYYPTSDFDLQDRYRLAALYFKYGSELVGEYLLQEIIEDDKLYPDPANMNIVIKTSCKLLSIYHDRKNKDSIEALIGQISQTYSLEGLSSNNMYKLAVAYLRCGKKKEGSELLIEITDQYPHTTFGRKALFLLGRLSQSMKDWDSAIGYYAQYVKRYPFPPFFALKAYSRLIDSYWSRDADHELVQDQIRNLADIVNNVSDFETQLNFARDLKWKGMDELASATFSLGLSSAKKFISENEDSYKALRAHWIIEKYAYALDRFDLVEASGQSIIDMINESKYSLAKKEKSAKIEYITSQTYLWLAKVHTDKNDYSKATRFLKMFIEAYPRHEEIDYARYELGRVYENAEQVEEATGMYRMVGDSMWKKKAEKRLSIAGF